MKNIGNHVKTHTPKPILSLLYLIPVFLLLVGIVAIAVAMVKASDAQRNYYYIGIGILCLLAIILLVMRRSALPKYHFELYENGIKIIYKKEKLADEEFSFEDISEIWNFSTNESRKANHLAFLATGSDYKVISPKYSDSKGLIKQFIVQYVKALEPTKSVALTKGERLTFPILPIGGENVVLSEKAIIPYLRNAQKGHLSLDRFSVFDGQKTYSLTDVDSVAIDKDANITMRSIAGNTLYSHSYFSVCNADLFVALMNDIAMHKTENPQAES